MRDHVPVTSPAPAPTWAAPVAGAPVQATVRIPGSKSLTNRALVLAAQATGPSTICGALRSRDTDLMAAALRSLGCGIEPDDGGWTVRPGRIAGPATIDCGLAGTVMRFLPPLAATGTGAITFDGDAAARRRPMAEILNALRHLGAEVDGDALPFMIHGTGGLAGGVVRIDASASSQFVSGLLLSGACYTRGLTLVHDGKPVPSLPHITMTVAALRSVGVTVDDSAANTWRVGPGPIAPWTAPIEPDLSNAAPFLAAAAVTGGTVTVTGWPAATTQAGDAIRWILGAMGASVDRSGAALTVRGGAVQGIDADLHEVGELTPTVAAVAALATSPSMLTGIGHLRGHETDRLAALAANLGALGALVEAGEDFLRINPQPLHGGTWAAYGDHRMATAGAVIGLLVPGVTVDDIATTAKTLPGFEYLWADMLGQNPNRGQITPAAADTAPAAAPLRQAGAPPGERT